jgi:hypothetical protein
MSDGMVCVKRNGVSYCWNIQTGCVEIFTKEKLDKADCPADVFYELLELVSKRVQSNIGGN